MIIIILIFEHKKFFLKLKEKANPRTKIYSKKKILIEINE